MHDDRNLERHFWLRYLLPIHSSGKLSWRSRIASRSRIAFLGANANLLSNDDRLKGYKQAFSQLKVKFDHRLVVSADLNRRGGFDGVQELMKTEDPPTAVLCFNDVVALGAMEGIQRLGLKPGIAFGVVGFNNIPEAAQCVPALTTIDNSPASTVPGDPLVSDTNASCKKKLKTICEVF